MTAPVTQDGWTGRERDLASREIPAPVTQAARDAAADYLADADGADDWQFNVAEVRAGRRDDDPAVLAFAKAIAEERERAAKVARFTRVELQPFVDQASIEWCGEKERETFPEDLVYFRANWYSMNGLYSRVIATAIRATVGEVGK